MEPGARFPSKTFAFVPCVPVFGNSCEELCPPDWRAGGNPQVLYLFRLLSFFSAQLTFLGLQVHGTVLLRSSNTLALSRTNCS